MSPSGEGLLETLQLLYEHSGNCFTVCIPCVIRDHIYLKCRSCSRIIVRMCGTCAGLHGESAPLGACVLGDQCSSVSA
eukprot:6020486-Pleurochrysis_carterae.AAC.1